MLDNGGSFFLHLSTFKIKTSRFTKESDFTSDFFRYSVGA